MSATYIDKYVAAWLLSVRFLLEQLIAFRKAFLYVDIDEIMYKFPIVRELLVRWKQLRPWPPARGICDEVLATVERFCKAFAAALRQ